MPFLPSASTLLAVLGILGYLIASITAWAKLTLTVNRLETSLSAHLEDAGRELERFIVLETRFNETAKVAERDRDEIKKSLENVNKKLDELMLIVPKREEDGKK